jgi:hypothetical protein
MDIQSFLAAAPSHADRPSNHLHYTLATFDGGMRTSDCGESRTSLAEPESLMAVLKTIGSFGRQHAQASGTP